MPLSLVVSTILVIVGGQDISTSIAIAIPLAAAGQVLTYVVRALTVGFNMLLINQLKTVT